MKLLCDEGLERQIVEGLRRAGHEVLYVAEMSSGISDAEVLDLSSGEEAVLITTDRILESSYFAKVWSLME